MLYNFVLYGILQSASPFFAHALIMIKRHEEFDARVYKEVNVQLAIKMLGMNYRYECILKLLVSIS